MPLQRTTWGRFTRARACCDVSTKHEAKTTAQRLMPNWRENPYFLLPGDAVIEMSVCLRTTGSEHITGTVAHLKGAAKSV